MRLFVGIPVRPSEGLLEAVRDLARRAAGVRAVPAGNLHLTLRFLGEVADAAPVEAALRAALAGAAPVRGTLAGLGGFPGERHARVAWAGVRADGLAEVAEWVRLGTLGLGQPEAHPFTAHLTLARLSPPADLRAWCAAHAGRDWGSLAADAVVLYRSRPGPGGSIYEALAAVPLRAPQP